MRTADELMLDLGVLGYACHVASIPRVAEWVFRLNRVPTGVRASDNADGTADVTIFTDDEASLREALLQLRGMLHPPLAVESPS